MDEGTATSDDFTTRLGWIFLRAYADGTHVQGEWALLDAHEEVPDVMVEVDATSESYDALGGGETNSQAITAFKSALQSFLLREFGTGTDITGTHRIRFVPNSLPAWNVTIRLPNVEDEDRFLRSVNGP